MKRSFNVTGACDPRLHYMVDLTDRLKKVRSLVDKGAYFTINRARQYGKTTMLNALKKYLEEDHTVVSVDFQFLSHASFQNEAYFVRAFSRELVVAVGGDPTVPEKIKSRLQDFSVLSGEGTELGELFAVFSHWCAASVKPVVLMIDEVDSATNNQVFLDFLSQLRGYYIHRVERPTFQSVILAGVYDVKNIRRKIRQDEEHDKINSPWNIATDFKVDMNFTAEDIGGMLREYEADHRTGMDVEEIARLIYEYTAGYPFLVSRICQIIDEEILGPDKGQESQGGWTRAGFLEAVKTLVGEKNVLFESFMNKLTDYPELRKVIYAVLFYGREVPYNAMNKSIGIAEMFGIVRHEEGKAVIANRIFESVFYDMFLSEELVESRIYASALQDRSQFTVNGRLDMKLVLERFVETFDDLYGDKEEAFLEDVGRKYFMLFLKPIINGTGNCYVEAQTRNMKRTDMIIDYGGEQFVVELKIWRGPGYDREGEKQLAEYLSYHHLNKGYMLTFNFNQKKEIGVKETRYGDMTIVKAMV